MMMMIKTYHMIGYKMIFSIFFFDWKKTLTTLTLNHISFVIDMNEIDDDD